MSIDLHYNPSTGDLAFTVDGHLKVTEYPSVGPCECTWVDKVEVTLDGLAAWQCYERPISPGLASSLHGGLEDIINSSHILYSNGAGGLCTWKKTELYAADSGVVVNPYSLVSDPDCESPLYSAPLVEVEYTLSLTGTPIATLTFNIRSWFNDGGQLQELKLTTWSVSTLFGIDDCLTHSPFELTEGVVYPTVPATTNPMSGGTCSVKGPVS